MGWCLEFGVRVHDTCGHPMVAGSDRCTCETCGASCKGQFAGCAEVWASGPRVVKLVDKPAEPAMAKAATAVAVRNGKVATGQIESAFSVDVRARGELDLVRDELGMISQVLDRVTAYASERDRFLELSGSLPDRISDAMAKAFDYHHSAMSKRLDTLMQELQTMMASLAARQEALEVAHNASLGARVRAAWRSRTSEN